MLFSIKYYIGEYNIYVSAIMKYYSKLGLQAVKAVCRIEEVEGIETISACIAQRWFYSFKSCDLSFEIKTKSGWPSVINYDALKTKGRRETDNQYLKTLRRDRIIKRY